MVNKRTFVIVIDSLGCGYDNESHLYGDEGANTLKHIFEAVDGKYQIPNLNKLGLCNLTQVKGNPSIDEPSAYYCRLHEASVGKDTMNGHWEMMGILTTKPFVTFTETGFPEELVKELEEKTGYKYIGNKSASGTEILKELGERQLETKELILYTSADSVLQIAAHEEVIGLDELYRCCKIAREITMKPEWLVGRVIARPFLGDNKDNFTRTPNRHDYAVAPSAYTIMDGLKDAGYDVISVGKINDIFSGKGITKAIKSSSSVEGMKQTIGVAKEDFNGLCFTNLVDFDAKWGHRRNPEGYAQELVEFDKLLPELIDNLKEDDLLIITADHGNDPTWKGSDHTREYVPLLIVGNMIKKMNNLGVIDGLDCISATILDLFKTEERTSGESLLDRVIKK